MKIIVSHLSSDIDSITSVWLIKRFLPGWDKAEIKFVAAGSTLDDKMPDENAEIIHVDTGLGRFDHHQNNLDTSASQLVFYYLREKNYLKKKYLEPLERMSYQITIFDHFKEVYFPDPTSDHYEFMLHKIIDGGIKSILKDDIKINEAVFPFLDAVLNIFIKKVNAEYELKNGYVIKSKWGKTLVIETKNEEIVKLALKKGYSLVAKKDPERGNIRIKTLPEKKFDLKPLYLEILKHDKKGTWFLHCSGNMLLNSSSKNPNFVASSLSLKRLIEIIKSI